VDGSRDAPEEFEGMAPTGRQVTVPGTVFYLLALGKITQFQGFFDGLALMQQLGVILPTSQAIPSSG
jgi:predicted ester cyclase